MSKTTIQDYPISPYVRTNDLLFISGTLSENRDSLEHEIHGIMKQLGILLNENGLDYGNLVSVTIYLKSMTSYALTNEIYRSYFGKTFPTRTCIAVSELPLQARIEMSAIARFSTSTI